MMYNSNNNHHSMSKESSVFTGDFLCLKKLYVLSWLQLLPLYFDTVVGFASRFLSLFICTYRKPGFNRARNNSLPNTEGISNSNEGLRIHNGGESLVRKREARITKASIGITIMFLICNTPRVIPNLVEVLMDQNAFPKVIKKFYTSVNFLPFLIHLPTHVQFCPIWTKVPV